MGSPARSAATDRWRLSLPDGPRTSRAAAGAGGSVMSAAGSILRRAFLACLLLLPLIAAGQTVEVERGERVAGLWCFPVFNRPGEWVYVPAQGRLAVDEDGNPRFSFVRYAFNRASDAEGGETITRAD